MTQWARCCTFILSLNIFFGLFSSFGLLSVYVLTWVLFAFILKIRFQEPDIARRLRASLILKTYGNLIHFLLRNFLKRNFKLSELNVVNSRLKGENCCFIVISKKGEKKWWISTGVSYIKPSTPTESNFTFLSMSN